VCSKRQLQKRALNTDLKIGWLVRYIGGKRAKRVSWAACVEYGGVVPSGMHSAGSPLRGVVRGYAQVNLGAILVSIFMYNSPINKGVLAGGESPPMSVLR
jgi:hypothetical protein